MARPCAPFARAFAAVKGSARLESAAGPRAAWAASSFALISAEGSTCFAMASAAARSCASRIIVESMSYVMLTSVRLAARSSAAGLLRRNEGGARLRGGVTFGVGRGFPEAEGSGRGAFFASWHVYFLANEDGRWCPGRQGFSQGSSPLWVLERTTAVSPSAAAPGLGSGLGAGVDRVARPHRFARYSA